MGARAHATRRLKFTLPGPDDDRRHDRRRALPRPPGARASRSRAAINEEARELAALGLDVLQLDEPAFNVYLDDVEAWGIDALHAAIDGLRCTTAVHICYGYGIKANIDWKQTLGGEWRQYERTFPLLAKSRIGQVSLECANSRVPLELLKLLGDKDVLAGAVDVATRTIETPEEVAANIRAVMKHVAARAALSVHELRDGRAPARRRARASWRRSRPGAAIVRARVWRL